MSPQRVDIVPYFVDHKRMSIGTIPVDVELERTRFRSRHLEINQHSLLIRVGSAGECPVLRNDTVRARFPASAFRKLWQDDRHRLRGLFAKDHVGSRKLEQEQQARFLADAAIHVQFAARLPYVRARLLHWYAVPGYPIAAEQFLETLALDAA
jgi:hypothetical protein